LIRTDRFAFRRNGSPACLAKSPASLETGIKSSGFNFSQKIELQNFPASKIQAIISGSSYRLKHSQSQTKWDF